MGLKVYPFIIKKLKNMLTKQILKSNIYKMALIGKMLPNRYKFQEYSKFQKI
jgi:hypothetical protein